jgi:hypothetical protein
LQQRQVPASKSTGMHRTSVVPAYRGSVVAMQQHHSLLSQKLNDPYEYFVSRANDTVPCASEDRDAIA